MHLSRTVDYFLRSHINPSWQRGWDSKVSKHRCTRSSDAPKQYLLETPVPRGLWNILQLLQLLPPGTSFLRGTFSILEIDRSPRRLNLANEDLKCISNSLSIEDSNSDPRSTWDITLRELYRSIRTWSQSLEHFSRILETWEMCNHVAISAWHVFPLQSERVERTKRTKSSVLLCAKRINSLRDYVSFS